MTCKEKNTHTFNTYYIYIAHLESRQIFKCRFTIFHFPAQATLSYCVIPLFLRGSHPSQINSQGSIQACHLIWGNTSFFVWPFNAALIHTFIYGRQNYGDWACSDGPHMFLYVHQSHRHDSTHPSLFRSWGALRGPLVCSYDISHSRTQQVSITYQQPPVYLRWSPIQVLTGLIAAYLQ